MRASALRRLFLDYFTSHGHREVPSSPLVPADDPTLLFTNAGMVQFKRAFLGQERLDYARATTCQKVVRAGGKHNDLEQVGLTKRHHTFFEMLGNFSFGDYFKREAIGFAWEFVTGAKYLALPADRIRVSVHHSDQEARALWREVTGLPDSRIYGLGDADNFWQMGDSGPCGPCSEIFVDLAWTPGTRSTEWSQQEFEALAEAGRLLEIWNLVFMQFDRAADGTLTPLPRPSVDTGAGLERIAAVLQGEDDNFHTDLFLPLLDRVAALVGRAYPRSMVGEGASFRVLADHARAVTFLMADGVYPSNEGRGYVLRRILRRAVRHAWLLGRRSPTVAPLTDVVIREMHEAYPELAAKRQYIKDLTETEERRFLETIDGGLKRLDEIFGSGATLISGKEAFRLYDTFGFPFDLTHLIAAERGVAVDQLGFEAALEGQRSRSRAATTKGKAASRASVSTTKGGRDGVWRTLKRVKQKFVGYKTTDASTELLAFHQAGERVEVLLRENPFYVESGGQVSDTGALRGEGWTLEVDTVRKDEKGTVLGGAFSQPFEPTPVRAVVDANRRRDIERNHSATHLVHAALRRHLGTHVRQQGSLVEPGRLRFDFSHHAPIESVMLERLGEEVNEQIWANHEVATEEMKYPAALALGAMAFFSEKYGDVVRVVTMGDSIELCGGTHVKSTGGLGLFRLVSQSGVAAGVRRVEAVTGRGAYDRLLAVNTDLHSIGDRLKSAPEHLLRKLDQLLAEREKLEAKLAEMRKHGSATGPDAKAPSVDIKGVSVLIDDTDSEDREEIGAMADAFRAGMRKAILVLFGTGGRGAIHVSLSDDLVQVGRTASDLVNRIAAVSGGKGGGRPHFASAGAGDLALLPQARAEAPRIISEWLAAG